MCSGALGWCVVGVVTLVEAWSGGDQDDSGGLLLGGGCRASGGLKRRQRGCWSAAGVRRVCWAERWTWVQQVRSQGGRSLPWSPAGVRPSGHRGLEAFICLVREVGFQKHFDKTQGGRDGKRFPRGKHLTNPAGPRGAEQVSRQPSQQIQPEL